MDPLAERGAGVVPVRLGPEQGEDGVTAMKPMGGGSGEIREERDTLGLGQYRRRVAPFRRANGGRAEQLQAD